MDNISTHVLLRISCDINVYNVLKGTGSKMQHRGLSSETSSQWGNGYKGELSMQKRIVTKPYIQSVLSEHEFTPHSIPFFIHTLKNKNIVKVVGDRYRKKKKDADRYKVSKQTIEKNVAVQEKYY